MPKDREKENSRRRKEKEMELYIRSCHSQLSERGGREVDQLRSNMTKEIALKYGFGSETGMVGVRWGLWESFIALIRSLREKGLWNHERRTLWKTTIRRI